MSVLGASFALLCGRSPPCSGQRLGSLRIEGMELEPELREVLERFSRGEIDLAEMRAEISYLAKTIV
jgi:hypothetical protein